MHRCMSGIMTELSIWQQIGIVDVRCSESDLVLMIKSIDGVGCAPLGTDGFFASPCSG